MRAKANALRVVVLAAFVPVASAAVAVPELRVDRRVEASTCATLVGSSDHLFLVADGGTRRRLVDSDARAWLIDQPIDYAGDAARVEAQERHRVGEGSIVVRAALDFGRGRFAVDVGAEPAGDFAAALAQYLPGVALPCHAEGTLAVAPGGDAALDPDGFARVQSLLHQATEALYVPDFARAEQLLGEAERIDPRSDTVRWMQARERYLAGEALPREDRAGRMARFEESEAFADQAVELAPEHGEGWLWRAVARGRQITTQGTLATALATLGRQRGPAWIAQCFERAIALQPTWRHFNHSAYGDALYGAAQLYRLLPTGRVAASLIGVGGDIDRAVDLARRALALQPNRIEYAKELGADLLCRSAREERGADRAEARRVLEAAAALPARTLYDRVDRKHALRLLREMPASACDYSRDLWLEDAEEAG